MNALKISVAAASVIAVFSAALVIADEDNAPESTVSTEPPFTYTGFTDDTKRLRETVRIPVHANGPILNVSSKSAHEAAAKIFRRVSFLHREREGILKMLGDPRTISDYGKAAGDGESDPLVYVFDNGFTGMSYRLAFENKRCVSITFTPGE